LLIFSFILSGVLSLSSSSFVPSSGLFILSVDSMSSSFFGCYAVVFGSLSGWFVSLSVCFALSGVGVSPQHALERVFCLTVMLMGFLLTVCFGFPLSMFAKSND
jgi:hypothetical protein